MKSFSMPMIPGKLDWHIAPLSWRFDPGGELSIVAGEETDFFHNPNGTMRKDNAPVALFTPTDANFLLSAKVAVDFDSAFDAGALQIRVNDDLWAKLCFEYSPQGEAMIVSVVTRGLSDDCNSVIINGAEIYLRVARTPNTLAFHYSHDGRLWHFVRYFSLGETDVIRAGFSAQEPTGKQCAVIFSEIDYRPGVLKDNRNGE